MPNRELITDEDINQIENVMQFANGLILKDTEKAESFETNLTYLNSGRYIDAKLKILNLAEDENDPMLDAIVNGYTESNSYYKELKDNHNIDYITSRLAIDKSILGHTNNTLDTDDIQLFYSCYNESLHYYNRVISTKAFNNQPMNKGFIRLFLVFSTVDKFLTRKMNVFFDIDKYSRKDLKNAFISSGLDFFEDMPIDYQRRLLKMIDTLIKFKGTNTAIRKTLEIFGFNNLDIYKYVLVKGYNKSEKTNTLDPNNPYLFFVKTKAEEEVNLTSDIILDYNGVVNSDPYWQASEQEILLEDFNMVNTKYLSVDTSIDAMKESIGLSYFMSLLKKVESDYKSKTDKTFSFRNKNISTQPILIFDSIVALQALIVRYHGYVDTINTNVDSVNYIYGYNDIENKIDMNSLMTELSDILVKQAKTVNNFELLTEFIKEFKLEGFESKPVISMEVFLEVLNRNNSMKLQIEKLIIDSENYDVYRTLMKIYEIKMFTKNNKKVYQNKPTYRDYLLDNNFDLYNYLIPPDTIKNNADATRKFYRDCIFDLTESISNYIGDVNVRKYFINNSYIGLVSSVEKYLYTIVSLFKSYTVDLLSANIILRFDSSLYNRIKLFDEIDKQTELTLAERVDLLDIANFHTYNMVLKDKIQLKDSIKITVEEQKEVDNNG